MPSRFERLRAFLERVAFSGLKPDVQEAPKKSKLKSLIQSAENLASLGLQSEEKSLPGPMTLRHKLAIVAGLLLAGIFVYVLIGILRRPAEQKEGTAPPPPPMQIVAPGTKIEKNKDLEVVEIDFNKASDPKVIT